MSRIYPTKNDLSDAVRKEMAGLLNSNLATSVHLVVQSKQAHWNVKGPTFYQLHELFDDVHDRARKWMDLIAERAVQLGGVAEATLETISERTKLAPYPLNLSTGQEHAEALSRSLAILARSARSAIDVAATAGDADTADVFTEVSRGADKMLWFVEAHLQAER